MKSTRGRGAQRGNQNALKHGLYSKHYSTEELTDLDLEALESLHDEIILLRVLIARLWGKIQTETELSNQIKLAYAIQEGVKNLAAAARAEHLISGGVDELNQQIISLIAEQAAEWK